MNNWLNKIQSSIYPYHCLFCGKAGHKDLDLCQDCLACLKKIELNCRQCGVPLVSIHADRCGACLKSPPYFDKAQALFHYESSSSFLIQSLKFNKKFYCARTMGLLMARYFKPLAVQADVIIPIPLHNKRSRERGFNQSSEIAASLIKEFQLPLDKRSLKRIINTPQQSSLTAKQRRNNIKGAFVYQPSKAFDSVILLDDVITTGSTANEAAKTLKAAGVKRVEVWAFARA